MSEPEAPRHFPSPAVAFALTMGAWLVTGFLIALLGREIDIVSLGMGEVFGFGLVATLAARRVPEPQAERLGLRGFAPRFLPALMLLLPVVIVSSELDNLVKGLMPPPELSSEETEMFDRLRESLAAGGWLGRLQTLIVVVGLTPVVEEWLFRGVLQQGLIAHMGRAGGLLLTAALFAFGHLGPSIAAGSSVGIFASSLLLGLVLGIVRIATGSLLATILLHAATNALGLVAAIWQDALAIPGYNVPGEHTPPFFMFMALIAVALGTGALARSLRSTPWVLPLR